jgi:hypothetical protein
MTKARRLFALLFVLVCLRGTASAQPPQDHNVLGPQWKQLSRAAGVIFAGTVLRLEASPADTAQSIPIVQITFRVDQPIAGIERDEELTIREWAGAWANHRPMRVGEHLLLFLYPPSQLGLTSPVGGQAGLLQIDSLGRIVLPKSLALPTSPRIRPPLRTPTGAARSNTTVRQLVHSIRSAREE